MGAPVMAAALDLAPHRSPHQTIGPARRSEFRRAYPNVVLAVIAAGGLAAVWPWGGRYPSIHGIGDWLTNAGRISGLLAGYGVVVLVALMARLPVLENSIGADRLARWHSRGGRYTVSLVVVHGLLIVWGYAITAHTTVIN